MKEKYFTSSNINEKSIEMLQKLEQYNKKNKIDFIPEHSALLILDMQKFFINKNSHAYISSALPIIPKIKKLANLFLKLNLPVILTQHINKKENAKMMLKWWRDLIRAENPLSEIISELNFQDAILIKKTQYDAFYETNLENLLKEKDITQIIITGVMTHLCCETTARSAFVRGFEVFFAIDGNASYNQDFHFASLLNLANGFAIPSLMEEIYNTISTYEKRLPHY